MELSSIYNFLLRICNSILGFASSVIDFMGFQIGNVSVFEILFGASVTLFLVLAIGKWAF